MIAPPHPHRPHVGPWRARVATAVLIGLTTLLLIVTATWFRAPMNWPAFAIIAVGCGVVEWFPLSSSPLRDGTTAIITVDDAPIIAAVFVLDPFTTAIAIALGCAVHDIALGVNVRHRVTNLALIVLLASSVTMIAGAPVHDLGTSAAVRILLAAFAGSTIDLLAWNLTGLAYGVTRRGRHSVEIAARFASLFVGLAFGIPAGVLALVAPWAIVPSVATFAIVILANSRLQKALTERSRLENLNDALASAWDATTVEQVEERLVETAGRAIDRDDVELRSEPPRSSELGVLLDATGCETRWLVISRGMSARQKLAADERYLRTLTTVGVRALEHAVLQEQLLAAARHDALTGLPNRRLFETLLDHELAAVARGAQRVAVLFIDINGFKAINDQHGHEAGDDVLRIVAARLKAAVRQQDVVARLGGDEFTILCGDISTAAAAVDVATRLLSFLETPITVAGQRRVIGASVGVAIAPEDGTTSLVLVRAADGAMYEAKRSGGLRRIALATTPLESSLGE